MSTSTKTKIAARSGDDLAVLLRAEATRRAKQADRLVRDNPYYAAGIAAGIGAIVGILVARSCSTSR